MNNLRLRILGGAFARERSESSGGRVVYWMNRDMRSEDNWALIFASEMATQRGRPLGVMFCLADDCPGATLRSYQFMIDGLKKTTASLDKLGIPFFLVRCDSCDADCVAEAVWRFCEENFVSELITDFNPLRMNQTCNLAVADRIGGKIPFYQVDAHNVVPCWLASVKEEYGAYTLRPKIHRRLGEFLDDFPKLPRQHVEWDGDVSEIDWDGVLDNLKLDRSVKAVDGLVAGRAAGMKTLQKFIDTKLEQYKAVRNDPTVDGLSHLSPYLHFGQISAQRVALEIQDCGASIASKEGFLDQLIVWRELSDNFCFYNSNYDSTGGFANWAKTTLDFHRDDIRDPLYDLETLEKAETYDELWNAAQLQMVKFGKMHGYMRMYWAKKILEWSESPEAAMEYAIFLNDKYEIDGLDPNGYANIAWSVGGVHDHGWRERPIYGKVRYMSYNGAKSKFAVDEYIKRFGR